MKTAFAVFEQIADKVYAIQSYVQNLGAYRKRGVADFAVNAFDIVRDFFHRLKIIHSRRAFYGVHHAENLINTVSRTRILLQDENRILKIV